MAFLVGLTGGIGSGKSTVARMFAALGAEVIDADELVHQLTGAGGAAMAAIRAEFGADYVDAHGALERARMRERVFADRAAKAKLEAILHPLVRAETDRRAAHATGPYVILMIPLLVETGDPRTRCDRVLVVDCPEELQIERVVARSGLSRAEAQAIMAAQASRAERLRHADDVIENDGSPEDLRPQVERLHRDYLARAGRH